eukprot:3572047-Rhodomonas_salina.1
MGARLRQAGERVTGERERERKQEREREREREGERERRDQVLKAGYLPVGHRNAVVGDMAAAVLVVEPEAQQLRNHPPSAR